MDSLNTIFVRHGADKQEAQHGYSKHYEPLLEPWRKQPIVLLEIGVWHGASIASWLEYFENAEIIGIDNDGACWKSENPRYTPRFTAAATPGIPGTVATSATSLFFSMFAKPSPGSMS